MENTQAGREMTLQEALHDLRKKIDALILYSGTFKVVRMEDGTVADLTTDTEDKKKFGREIALVYTKLQEAKMWAGKCLEQIGSELPKEFRDKAN